MDGDGQHNPLEIISLVKPIIEGKSDFVIGYRDLRDAPLTRQFSNFLTKYILRVFTKLKIEDPLCGFRAVKKDAFDKFILTEEGYEFEIETIFEALKHGSRTSNHPVSVDYKTGKSSITP